eukprot:scaffold386_cov135-Skeletonema_menzelii.AAC.7
MKGNSVDDGNSKERRRLFNPSVVIASTMQSIKAWAAQDKNGLKDFIIAQLKVTVILLIAYVGNKFEPAYPRNDNHHPEIFWIVNAILTIGTFFTWKWEASKTGRSGGSPRIICLGREQTEEWKGWMQWAFIFYHYYRADFSIERFVSMIIRINYFPLLLSFFLTVPLELYYVVPLHTTGFIVTMITCWIGYKFENTCGMGYWKSRTIAVALSLFVHIIFYETPAVNFLLLFSKEYHFRFQADKYSAWLGMASGLLWGKVGEYMQWAHGFESDQRRHIVSILQFCGGFGLIAFWYGLFGSIQDKYTYNPVHPYVFIFAVIGWLMIRNCTSGADGSAVLKFLNMLLCGSVFLTTAVFARKVTVSTQLSVVDLVKNITGTMDTSITQVLPQHSTELKDSEHEQDEETVELTKAVSTKVLD